VVRRLFASEMKEMGFKSRANQISYTFHATRHPAAN